MLKNKKKAWEVIWAEGAGVTFFESRRCANYFETSVKDTGNEWVSTKLVDPPLGVKVFAKKVRVKAQQREHTYHGTSYDVPGTPLPPYQEPYKFPMYITDEVRLLSLIELVPDIAETIVSLGPPWQDSFNSVLMAMDANEFGEVRRRVFQLLPEEVQTDIEW